MVHELLLAHDALSWQLEGSICSKTIACLQMLTWVCHRLRLLSTGNGEAAILFWAAQ
jgi:hypothetical protein